MLNISEIEGGICCDYERDSFTGARSQVCRDMVPVGCCPSAEGRKVCFGPECGPVWYLRLGFLGHGKCLKVDRE